ncbi:hypothetical protein ILUMI_02668 [Ignelater luminosus]|uniref:Uncharacterized protein n=1 Tax=Ignelater luminosus TaxID=2038154 RepID=A0A8K0GJ28_IGNLU|nr:hypothetical protein ILUMI_02668 [Ignelater luminosus]
MDAKLQKTNSSQKENENKAESSTLNRCRLVSTKECYRKLGSGMQCVESSLTDVVAKIEAKSWGSFTYQFECDCHLFSGRMEVEEQL